MSIFFSIIVPTCERVEILEPVLKALLNLEYDNYEIIVSSNASRDDTLSVVSKIKNESSIPIVLVKTEERLDICAHWDFALSHANGDYIIICGDDDFLAPKALSYANQIISEYNSDLLVWKSALYYHENWSVEPIYPDISPVGNVIQAQPGASGYLFQVDPSVMIERFCKFDFRNFPNVCNFVFSKSLANEIIEETGRFFWPMAPDYSATLLLMCKTQKPYFFDEYCCFGGRSLKSNYHSILVRQKNGRMDDFINEFDDSVDKMPFHSPQLPSYWNHLIAPVAIARQLYPNEMGEFDISRSEFVKRIYSEIYSTMERLPHWEDERLIDAWRGYFRKAGVSNYELDKVASDASIANQPLEKEQIKPSSINMLQLESLQIQSLVQLMKQFDKVLPFLRRRVSQEFSIMKNRAFKFVKEME